MRFFTSDEHIGHANIINFCKRPFKDIYECRDVLLKKHNDKVKDGDLVYHLGDMFWRTWPLKDALDYIYALNGTHYFVWGNHDELIEGNEILRKAFVWCKDLAMIGPCEITPTEQSPKIVLCHYAMHTWRNSHKGAWQLFGHTHGNLPETQTLNIDVGVDAWNFEPVSLVEIKEAMDRKARLGHADPMLPAIKKQVWDKGINCQ